MKKLFILILAISLFTSCNNSAKKKETTNIDLTTNRIEVLEFYGKHRCNSCIDIERNTKTTLAKHFKKEMDSKEIVYKLVQWDIPENEVIVNKFEAAGTELIIYRVKDGKEFIDNISDWAFKKSDKDKEFEEQFTSKVKKALELQK